MAIIPKLKWPAQIVVSDPGYPHGKAKNVNVAGDGSGTPFEADLVNDVFGFQQALLLEGEVDPSGAPDKVGTSQYLTALKAVIDKAFGVARTVGGVFSFAQSIKLLGFSTEVLYSSPRLTRALLPLSPAGTFGSAAYLPVPAGADWVGGIFATDAGTIRLTFVLPTGSRLQMVRVAVANAAAAAVKVHAYQIRSSTVGIVMTPPSVTDLLSVTQTFAEDGVLELDTSGVSQLSAQGLDTFALDIQTYAVGQTIAWVELTVLDPGPRNF